MQIQPPPETVGDLLLRYGLAANVLPYTSEDVLLAIDKVFTFLVRPVFIFKALPFLIISIHKISNV